MEEFQSDSYFLWIIIPIIIAAGLFYYFYYKKRSQQPWSSSQNLWLKLTSEIKSAATYVFSSKLTVPNYDGPVFKVKNTQNQIADIYADKYDNLFLKDGTKFKKWLMPDDYGYLLIYYNQVAAIKPSKNLYPIEEATKVKANGMCTMVNRFNTISDTGGAVGPHNCIFADKIPSQATVAIKYYRVSGANFVPVVTWLRDKAGGSPLAGFGIGATKQSAANKLQLTFHIYGDPTYTYLGKEVDTPISLKLITNVDLPESKTTVSRFTMLNGVYVLNNDTIITKVIKDQGCLQVNGSYSYSAEIDFYSLYIFESIHDPEYNNKILDKLLA